MGNRQSSSSPIIQSKLPNPPHFTYMKRLIWVKRTSALYQRMSANVMREVCQYITFRPLLTASCKAGIEVFDPAKMKGWKIELQGPDFTLPGITVCIGDGQVFVAGGLHERTHYTALSRTFVYDNGSVVALAAMRQRRQAPALYFDEKSRNVYVFGGIGKKMGALRSCERFVRKSWSTLPSMIDCRSHLSASEHKGKVYLCGGYCCTCEQFTVATEQFSLLPIKLKSANPYFSCVWNEQLIVGNWNRLNWWDLKSMEFLGVSKLQSKLYTTSVLVHEEQLFILMGSVFMCWCVSLISVQEIGVVELEREEV